MSSAGDEPQQPGDEAPSPASGASSPSEQPCPDCGEMVRLNSLRCWNCGGFMNPEVEARYLELQRNPPPVMLSSVPDDELVSVDNGDDEEDDMDFELNLPRLGADLSAQVAEAPDIEIPQEPLPGSEESEGSEESGQAGESGEAGAKSEEGGSAHSVATGGDALLDIALKEEAESRKRRKKRPTMIGGTRTATGGFLIFCPYGCKIEVKEQHRGMTGRCPRCRAPFIVPTDPPQFRKKKSDDAAEADQQAKGRYDLWLTDLHLHTVSPERLKLKADSLLKEFVEADFGFSKEEIFVGILIRGGGLFGGGGAKQKTDTREAMQAHFAENKSVEESPVAEKFVYAADSLSELKVVQPTASRADSIFHGIPVFGEGRIAIQLPSLDAADDPRYVSLGITEFWAFRKALAEHFEIEEFGANCGIPPEHVYSEGKCHYTDANVRSLENLEFYKADPTVELAINGYRCGACGLIVSEAGRKKENLGGKAGKAIAKAKCPKCSNKMGEHPLYALKEEISEPSIAGEQSRRERCPTTRRRRLPLARRSIPAPPPPETSRAPMRRALPGRGSQRHLKIGHPPFPRLRPPRSDTPEDHS